MDIVAVAESKRNSDHIVSDLHKDFKWIGKNRSKNRGGGIGFIYKSNNVSVINDDLLNSKDDHFERLWILIKVGAEQIALGVVYFPVDNDTRLRDEATELHNELIQNIGELQSDKILLLGDFNGKIEQFKDHGKCSSNGILVENIIEVTELQLLNTDRKCSGRITWNRGPLESVIDYAMCSNGMYTIIESMVVDEEKLLSIGSDHNFLAINARIPTILVKSGKGPIDPDHVRKWNISEKTNWKAFELATKECFANWNIDDFSTVDEIWLEFKSCLLSAGTKAVGYKQYNNKRSFWDKEIGRLIHDRRKANRLYRIWSKHPDSSPDLLSLLWDDYLEKKRKVADRVKQNAIKQKCKIIFDNASKASKNSRAYWNTLRRLNKSNDYPIQIRDPENPDTVISDPSDIKKTLTSYWTNLSKAPFKDNADISDNLDKFQHERPDSKALQSIEIDETSLKKAIAKLKNGKATGPDMIPGEFLKFSDSSVFSAFLQMFCKIKLLEQIPENWYEGIIKPLYKDGSREMLTNYRGITISSVAYKTLVRIIEDQIMSYLEDNNTLGELQGAFRKGRRVEDHLFSLKGICSIRKSAKSKTYLAFLDISKAFDMVDRTKLFSLLWSKGIQSKAWCMVKMLYERVDNKVIFGEFESDIIHIESGVKQGCVLSPSLFNLVISDLDNMLDGNGGVSIGAIHVNGLYYADDIVLMANDEEGLNLMLDIAHKFALKWGLKYNVRKSQVMVIGAKPRKKEWLLGDTCVKETKCYKYLGVLINNKLKDNSHLTDHIVTKAKKLESYIRFTLANHSDINRIDFGNSLWHSAVLPSISHAAGIWFNESISSIKLLQSAQYKCGKGVLKLHSMPSRAATLGELGWIPLTDELDIKRIAYYKHLLQMDSDRLTKIIFNELLSIYNSQVNTTFNYFKNIKGIFEANGADHMFQNDFSLHQFKKLVAHNNNTNFGKETTQKSSLRLYCSVKSDYQCSPYLNSMENFKLLQLKFKLRTGVAGIGDDMNRQHRGIGSCPYCGQYETAKHFILICDAYKEARFIMLSNLARALEENIFNFLISDLNYTLLLLLGDHDDVFNRLFLKFLSVAWPLRQSFFHV